jgi:hypothetical protein
MFYVIDREVSIASNGVPYFWSYDKRETSHFDSFIICLWLVQSQAHFGPASPYTAYEDAKQILWGSLIGLL